jgi:hypothetical protein
MMLAASIFIALSIAIVIVQLALAFGAPLGEYTLGGKFPGKLPVKMRVAALLQIFILLFFVFIVTSKSGLAFEQYYNFGRIGIWFVVAFFTFGSILNLTSPSKKEKLVMGPANIIGLISTLVVALG